MQDFICALIWLAFTDDSVNGARHQIGNILSAYRTETNEFFRLLILDIWGLSAKKDYVPRLSVNYWDSTCVNEILSWDFEGLEYNEDVRKKIYEVMNLDWGDVSAEVLGAILQDATARGISCYTTNENIHKVIGPLFLDELYQAYEDNKNDIDGLKTL